MADDEIDLTDTATSEPLDATVLAVLGSAATWEEVDAAWGDQLVATLLAADAADAAHSADGAAPAASSAPSAPVVPLSARRARRAPKAWIGGAVAAAAVALAVVVVATNGGDDADLTVALAGEGSAQGASGQVEVTFTDTGTRLDLDASQLPPAPEGSFYQGWVRNETSAVTIGTFSQPGEMTLWAGVPLDRYPVLTVTLEPEDGDPASSGVVVLRGRIPAGD